MSVAYFIILDEKNPGFDTFVNGKAIAKSIKKLDAIAKKLGIPAFDDLVAMSSDELSDMLGEDIAIPEQEEKWFTADEGINIITTLMQYIRLNPRHVKDSNAVLEDLAEYLEVFGKAKIAGAKWHLGIDI